MNKWKSWWRQEGSAYLFLGPYLILFALFIIIPVGAAILLSFTNFDSVNFPDWIGLKNYISLLTSDAVFMQYVVPNTLKFSFEKMIVKIFNNLHNLSLPNHQFSQSVQSPVMSISL